MVQECDKLKRRLVDRDSKRQHSAPAGRRGNVLAQPLMKLSRPDQGHQVALVKVQRPLKRYAFALVVFQLTSGSRKIEPQLSSVGRDLASALEVSCSRSGIASA